MRSSIQKWGNSLGMRIPKSIVSQAGFHSGSQVEIVAEDGFIAIYPKKYTLDELLEGITPETLHPPILDDVRPQGMEEW